MKTYITTHHQPKLSRDSKIRLLQHFIGLLRKTHHSYLIKYNPTEEIVGIGWRLGNGELAAGWGNSKHRGNGLHSHLIKERIKDGAYWTVIHKDNSFSEKSYKKLGWVSFPHPVDTGYNVWVDNINSFDNIEHWTNNSVSPHVKK